MGKYTDYSDRDPEFEKIRPTAEAMYDRLFSMPVKEMRAAFAIPPPKPDDLPTNLLTEDLEVSVRDGTRIALKLFRSPDVKPNALLYVVTHGGGWTAGGPLSENNMLCHVAGRCNAVVVSVDYRMGPENRYPYAVNDSYDVLKWCLEHAHQLGINPNRVVVGGSSAGGNIAAALALKARDEGLPGIVGQVLNIPATCHPNFFPKDIYEYESMEQNKDSGLLTTKRMLWFWDNYLGEMVEPDPYHSPLLAKSLKDLPPALLQVAGMDPLRDEGIAYGDALKAAGVRAQVEVYGGMPHGFGSMSALSKSKPYYSNIVNFINEL